MNKKKSISILIIILSFSNLLLSQENNILVYSGLDFGTVKLAETVDFNNPLGIYYQKEFIDYSYAQTKIGVAWERTSIGWSSMILGIEYGAGIYKKHQRKAQDITTGEIFEFESIDKTNTIRLDFSLGFAVIGDIDEEGFSLVANIAVLQEINLFTYYSNNPPSNYQSAWPYFNAISPSKSIDATTVTYLAPGLMPNYVLNKDISIFASFKYRFPIQNGSSEIEYGNGFLTNIGAKYFF